MVGPKRHGSCRVCKRPNIELKKDGTLRAHVDKSRRVPGYDAPRCKGAGELPQETAPLSGGVLREEIDAALREALQGWSVNIPVVTNAVLARIGGRVLHLEGQNAMLTDMVVGSAAMVFGQVSDRKMDSMSEELHLAAVELMQENPRLAGTYDPGPRS